MWLKEPPKDMREFYIKQDMPKSSTDAWKIIATSSKLVTTSLQFVGLCVCVCVVGGGISSNLGKWALLALEAHIK